MTSSDDNSFNAMNYWWKTAKAYEAVLEEIAKATIYHGYPQIPTNEAKLAIEALNKYNPRRKDAKKE